MTPYLPFYFFHFFFGISAAMASKWVPPGTMLDLSTLEDAILVSDANKIENLKMEMKPDKEYIFLYPASLTRLQKR